jgi:hypothetical protein
LWDILDLCIGARKEKKGEDMKRLRAKGREGGHFVR